MRFAGASLFILVVGFATRGLDATPEAAAPIVKRFEAATRVLQADHAKSAAARQSLLAETTKTAQKQLEDATSDAAALYGKLLDDLATKAKDGGDLDAVLSLKAEREKLTPAGITGKTAKLPGAAVKGRVTFDSTVTKAKFSSDSTIAKAKKEHESAERAALAAFNTKARETYEAYLRELTDLEKSETREGRIESAVAVRTLRQKAEKDGVPIPDFVPGGEAGSEFTSRTGAAKAKLLAKYGGTEESEAAVTRGLAYLARQQKADGSWVFDGSAKNDTVAATGLSLLAFLGAGETHKVGKKYPQTVQRGLQYLISQQKPDGSFKGTTVMMYSHGIATLALNEAYGMTKDRNLLLRPAQAATNYIVAKQGADGSWGYVAGTTGDTSIVGWQVQALKAAMISKDIIVPAKSIANVLAFLDKVSSGARKSVYGYTGPNGAPGTSLSAIGLLCRHTIGKWGADNPAIAEGVNGLLKRPQVRGAMPDTYFCYYATQVARIPDDDDWKEWNEGRLVDGKRQGGMRDLLVGIQEKREGANQGSWPADTATIGGSCGRLGSTAMSILTLEVYYRYPPLDAKPR
jgi:hypothetical protein